MRRCTASETEDEKYITFTYLREAHTYVSPDESSDMNIILSELDSVGVDSLGNTIFQERLHEANNIFATVHHPRPGDRYIVFLHVWTYSFLEPEGSPYYIVPRTMYQREGGMFKIADNQLLDQQNYFGQGHAVPLVAFKEFLRASIRELLSHGS